MAAAILLAAGLCGARRAEAVAGPRAAQVRGGRGAREGSRGSDALQGGGPRSSPAPHGVRSPAGNVAPPEAQAPGLCGEVRLVVAATSLKASPQEKRISDGRRPAQAQAPRSTQGPRSCRCDCWE